MSTATPPERYDRLPLDAIDPSPTNPRTRFDDAYLCELAKSIVEKGVVQPILVRPGRPLERYEIVCGECRWRASKIADASTIPAIIRVLTDDQVLELQLIENIHRQDLTALEQAAGYQALIAANPGKHTVGTIAGRLGLSEAWVRDRLKLNALVPAAKTLLERGRIATGHAILVARQSPATQQRLIDPAQGLLFVPVAHGPATDVRPVSVRELEVVIAKKISLDTGSDAQANPRKAGEARTRVRNAATGPTGPQAAAVSARPIGSPQAAVTVLAHLRTWTRDLKAIQRWAYEQF